MSEQALAHAPPEVRRPVAERLQTWLSAGVAVTALAATSGAVYVTAISNHAPDPAGHAAISVVVCLSFAGAGLVALRRAPYVRFGLLLAATGFASLLGVLHDANGAIPYTVGVFTANLVFAVLVHALLAFPHGRLGSRPRRLLAVAAYADVLLLQGLAVLFDPLTRWHSNHPHNAALLASHASFATVLEELEAGIAAALAIAVVFVLSRRARAATPAARRQLAPVLVGGKFALLFLSAGLVLAPISSEAAVVGIGLGLLAALALPGAFLGVLLQGRLSRAAVGELLVELRDPERPPGLEDALRRALGDPTLALARFRPESGAYVDELGKPLSLPRPGGAQVATPILHQGDAVGMLVHDRFLRLRPELLDAVSAAAGFALANERALATVQRVEARDRALLDALPDLMFRVSRDGTYLDVRADDPSGLLRPPEELVGINAREVLPPDVADVVLACVERALDTGAMASVEYELTIGGVARCFESRMVPSGADEVVTVVRDFTAQRRAEAEQRRLGEEQAALRRVATLVAGDAPPERVFQAVTEEVCRVLDIPSAALEHFEEDGTALVVGRFSEDPDDGFKVGTRLHLDEGVVALKVLRSGVPQRVDSYDGLTGEIADKMRAQGFSSTVALPVAVAGATWGALIVTLRDGETLPKESELRLQAFAELVALALASAHARNELAASRRRIIEASDAERRRLERNLHDGAQQRLVALSMALRLAQGMVRRDPRDAEELLSVAAEELSEALTELRELAQGLHPAVLTERGLAAALEVLAARTPLPVSLDIGLPGRPPEPVEATAYYVVSEALTNIVKHARATSACVRAVQTDGLLTVEVEDDGAGGADPGGSGLCGLRDRVETLDGRLELDSPPGSGTRVRAELPLRMRGAKGVGVTS